MTVWIVFSEMQNGDPSIEGVYSTAEAGEAARLETVRDWQQEYGRQVYGERPPDLAEDEEWDDSNWEVDVHLEAWDVDGGPVEVKVESPADPRCACGHLQSSHTAAGICGVSSKLGSAPASAPYVPCACRGFLLPAGM